MTESTESQETSNTVAPHSAAAETQPVKLVEAEAASTDTGQIRITTYVSVQSADSGELKGTYDAGREAEALARQRIRRLLNG